jgi:hypothetical protein
MMSHEGGTKFYEVILLREKGTNTSMCICRWGPNAARNIGGTFGKPKLLNKNYQSYVQAIISNKQKRGYKVESRLDVNITPSDILEAYRFEGHLDDVTNSDMTPARQWFRDLGWDRFAVGKTAPSKMSDEDIAENFSSEEFDPVVITQQQRCEAFGSW